MKKDNTCNYCPACNATGEGSYSGSICQACNGSGEKADESEQKAVNREWIERQSEHKLYGN